MVGYGVLAALIVHVLFPALFICLHITRFDSILIHTQEIYFNLVDLYASNRMSRKMTSKGLLNLEVEKRKNRWVFKF